MLRLNVEVEKEKWDESREEFVPPKYETIELEHSLRSISKWETKWHKAFLGKREKTNEELLDYISCMSLHGDIRKDLLYSLNDDNIESINKYIDDPMTSVCFQEDNSSSTSRDTVTSELIYYWMITAGIPFECDKWHINKLLSLIRVCSIKNSNGEKMNKNDLARRNAKLNSARKRKMGSRG